MAFIDVVDVVQAEPDPRLWGSHIELPRGGERFEGTRFELAGWILGARSTPSASNTRSTAR